MGDHDGPKPGPRRTEWAHWLGRARAAGIRLSPGREAILRVLFDHDEHFTVRELYARTEGGTDDAEGQSVGLATVYRAVKAFEEAGLVQRRTLHGEEARYELNRHGPHDHLVCLDCGQIVEFRSDALVERQREQADKMGFELTGHRLNLMARCEDPGCPRKT